MADADVWAVRFKESINFNNGVKSGLYRDIDKCILTRIAGGVKATLNAGGRPVIIPDGNIKSIEMLDEVKNRTAEKAVA